MQGARRQFQKDESSARPKSYETSAVRRFTDILAARSAQEGLRVKCARSPRRPARALSLCEIVLQTTIQNRESLLTGRETLDLVSQNQEADEHPRPAVAQETARGRGHRDLAPCMARQQTRVLTM